MVAAVMRAGIAHIVRGFACRDVLHHDAQLGKVAPQRNQLLVDEHRLAVEQVDVGRGDLAVHQQQQAFALHGLEHRIDVAQCR